MELKQCFDNKNIVLENFLTCFEDRVQGLEIRNKLFLLHKNFVDV